MVGDTQCCYREQVAFTLYSKFREPKLYRLAKTTSSYYALVQRARSHPKEASFVHKYAPNDTALHQVLRMHSCGTDAVESLQDAVSALLSANRQAATLRDYVGRTPLHLACMMMSPCPEQLVTLIISANPRAVAVQDMEGRTPLHYLLLQQQRDDDDSNTIILSTSLIQSMIHHCPSVVSIADAVKETPWHVLKRRKDEIHNANELMELLSQSMMSSSNVAKADGDGVLKSDERNNFSTDRSSFSVNL